MFGGRKKLKHIVVSYASGDRREAMAIVARLEREGILVWVAPRDIDPAQGAAGQHSEAIGNAAAVLLIVSANANQSKLLKTEAEIAVGLAPIIPVRIADVPPEQALRALVQGQASFDLFGERAEEVFGRLLEAAHGRQGQPRRKRAGKPVQAREPAAAIARADDITDDAAPVAGISSNSGPSPLTDASAPLGANAAARYFIGPRANAMLDRWRAMDRTGRVNSPFLPGLLFGRYWLAYRMLWRQALACSLIMLGLIGYALWTDANFGAYGAIAAMLGIGALAVLTWLRGIGVYRVHAERTIARWNASGIAEADAIAQLERRGGTRRAAAAALLLFEVAMIIGMAMKLDPDLVAWLITPTPPIPAQKLEIVSMTRPMTARTRYNFCLVNSTDAPVAFTLRYGTDQTQAMSLPAHSPIVTYWSRAIDPPVITFDHVLGDGATTTNLSYGLNTARTDDEKSCGGIVYRFVKTANELDLKLGDDGGTGRADAGSGA